METLKLLWFFVWRTTALAFGLGAAAGASYGAAVIVVPIVLNLLTGDDLGSIDLGVGLFWLIGTSLIFGASCALLGGGLGTLGGLLLFGATRAFYYPLPANDASYRKAAGRTCAGVGVVLLVADWMFHGFPDPDAFILSRNFGEYSLYDVSTLNITVLVIAPVLLLAWAMWFSGRKVAGQYARKAGGSETASDSAAESMPEG